MEHQLKKLKEANVQLESKKRHLQMVKISKNFVVELQTTRSNGSSQAAGANDSVSDTVLA